MTDVCIIKLEEEKKKKTKQVRIDQAKKQKQK